MPTTLAKPPESPIDLAAIEAELRPLATDKLRSTFVESYGKAASFLARAAVCVKLMDERGENLHGLPQLGRFRRIAAGQALPDLIWKFLESPALSLVERAPLNEQQKLVDNPVQPVVERAPDGGFTTRMTDLTRAPVKVVKQVLGTDGLRSPEEQMVYLQTQKRHPAAPAAPPEAPADEPLDRSVTVKLTASELSALNIHAALAGNISVPQMARRFLARAGAFNTPKT